MNFRRKNIRLSGKNYVGKGLYFVTICCHERTKIFSDSSYGHVVLKRLTAMAEREGFRLHAYCLMPDHLHFLALGTDPTADMLSFIGEFKNATTRAHKNRAQDPLWQTKFYDHILRSVDDTESVAQYIWANPVRKGICSDAAAYPLSGSQTIEWKSRTRAMRLWVPPWKSEKSPLQGQVMPGSPPRRVGEDPRKPRARPALQEKG